MLRFKYLDQTDRWVVSVTTLCALFLASWLAYDVLYHDANLQGQTEIGQIVETQNKVKRKFNKSLIWYQAKPDETLYENDWIFTGNDSAVRIRLNSGDEFAIEPDSLIVLSRNNGILQLDLQHGRMIANVVSSNVNVSMVKDGKKKAIDLASGMVRIDTKQELVASPIEGVESLDNALDNLSAIAPPPGYKAMDASDLLFPEEILEERELYPGQKAQFKLHWLDPTKKWASYNIEVSQDADFSETLFARTLSLPEAEVEATDSGLFYFKVQGVSEEGELSPWSDDQLAELVIHWREQGEGVQLAKQSLRYELNLEEAHSLPPSRIYSAKSNPKLKLEWLPKEEATSYKIQVSDKKDFSNIIEEKITDETKVQLENVKLGKNFVKVIAEDEHGNPITKASRAQVLTMFPPIPKEALKTKRISNNQLLMDWSEAPRAPGYSVTYSTEKDGENPQTDFVTEPQHKIETLSNNLRWQVQAIEPESREPLSRESESMDWYDQARKLASIENKVPEHLQGRAIPIITSPPSRKTYVAKKRTPLFMVLSWDYEEDAKAYEVEISRSPNMARPVFKEEVADKRKILNKPLPPGIYYLRVRALKEQVTEEVWSEVEAFRVIGR